MGARSRRLPVVRSLARGGAAEQRPHLLIGGLPCQPLVLGECAEGKLLPGRSIVTTALLQQILQQNVWITWSSELTGQVTGSSISITDRQRGLDRGARHINQS